METAAFISRLFDVIENDIAPKTREGVRKGNKIFGAAILRKSDLSVVVAETNNETENPLWHGEMHAIKKLYELNRATLPDPKDCIFLATHEPCSLCLSAITWAGYDNFYFLFSHEDSRDSFAIPHDIRILKEVFVPPGTPLDAPLYNASNAFWTSHSIARMIATLDRGNREALLSRMDDIGALYADLSATYQQDKGDKGIPLA
ncbi:nucleoside deaminase [Paradevosia shaoguanensis]|uniref:nucleoside deaminase n=1 Tax=Paradevosia shaoguanensis TaxID=1335043 RepID=UPI0019341DF6|nr:nucleoside deaminase [Paradevosia shaoguanensis]